MNIDIDLWRRRIREETFAQYHYEMARAIAREGNVDSAVEAYWRAIGIRRDYPEAYFRLIALLDENGKSDKAREIEAQALAVNPHYVAWSWHRFAQEACGEGRYADAVEALRTARSLHAGVTPDPELAVAYCQLAVEAERSGRYEEVASILDEGLGFAHDNPRMLWILGQTRLTMCQFEDASRILRRVLDQKPDDPLALSTLALSLQCCGDVEAALALHEKALAKAPHLPTVLTGAAFPLYVTGDLAAASDLIERARCLNARDPNVWVHRGIIAFLGGRLAEAEKNLQDALEILPGYGFAQSNLALVLEAMGRPEEALEMHRVSIGDLGVRRLLSLRLRPWAARSLADAYHKLGLSDAA